MFAAITVLFYLVIHTPVTSCDDTGTFGSCLLLYITATLEIDDGSSLEVNI